MAFQAECLGTIFSVERIGDDRMIDSGQMDADLMHHAALHGDFEQSHFTRLRETAITRARVPGFNFWGRWLDSRPHPPRIAGIVGERKIDLARLFALSPHQRPVNLFHPAFAKLSAQMVESGLRFGDQQNSSIFTNDRYLQVEFRQRTIRQQSRATGKDNPVARLEPIALARAAAVDGKTSVDESAVDLSPRKMRQARAQKGVEPNARLLGR